MKRILSFILAFVMLIIPFSIVSFAEDNQGTIIENGVLIKYNEEGKFYIIPNEVTKIGENAFTGCIEIEEIFIGDNVTEVKSNAFSDCSSLKLVCFSGNNEIVFGDDIADKSTVLLINNDNNAVRKSIAMEKKYSWSTYSVVSAMGKTVLAFHYGFTYDLMKSDCVDKLFNKFSPDYTFFSDTKKYYDVHQLSAKEVPSETYSPFFLVKLIVTLNVAGFPSKEDVEAGNDGILRLLGRLFNKF